ncbi:MAG TPA: nuclear transport factor 2 family protein [Steroidobacteraceae bacterium]|nr:nuclear transport factor 2 family protein [Steroidobacteraceae bacterium]
MNADRALASQSHSIGFVAAAAQTPEAELAAIEKNFAQVQITKDPKTIEALSAVMAADFYSFNPTRGVRITKKQLLDAVASPKYVVTSMDFPPFFIHVYGSTAIAEGTNTSTATWDGQNAGGSFVWFDVFEKRNGRWIWIVSQSSKADEKIAADIHCEKFICTTSHPGFSLK